MTARVQKGGVWPIPPSPFISLFTHPLPCSKPGWARRQPSCLSTWRGRGRAVDTRKRNWWGTQVLPYCCKEEIKETNSHRNSNYTALNGPLYLTCQYCFSWTHTCSGLLDQLPFFLSFLFLSPSSPEESSVSTILPNKWFWSSFITLLYSCLTNPLENVPVS